MFQINQDRLVKQFIDLIKIDSETKHESLIARYLISKFTSLGLEVIEDNAKEVTGHEANNLICNLPANKTGIDPLLFTAHMDTVIPGNNVQPSIVDGFIVSDGTTILGADDKAGIAVIIETIHVLQAENISHGALQFVITVGEESGLVGSKALDSSLLFAKYGYALDSDGPVGNIVVEAPYQAKLFTIMRGVSAHAGINPEKGISAIKVASKAIASMKLGRIDSETTANIGSFQGGTQTNIVCDHVEIFSEARSINQAKLLKVVENMQAAFHTAASDYNTTAEVNVMYMYEGYKFSKTDNFVNIAIESAEQLGLPGELIKSNGGSDANVFNSFGIPTVNLSVGYEHIHTTKERIHLDNVINLTKYVLTIINNFAKK